MHGGNSDVYGDVEAISSDLAWLEANGFTCLDWSSGSRWRCGNTTCSRPRAWWISTAPHPPL
ncbi:MAG: hypothetical protein NT158_03755 [Cyanobacteria bacterium]|nr:hypothetical protein [Cyanobacteriota bacterium]